MNDLESLLAVIREERDSLPSGKTTAGQSIHALIIEVLGTCVLKAIKKRNDSNDGNGK